MSCLSDLLHDNHDPKDNVSQMNVWLENTLAIGYSFYSLLVVTLP